MASEFQRRKITGVFDAMDSEDRGFLVERDFEALAARWTALRGVAPGSEQYVRLRTIMLGWWDSLSSAARDRDRVTLDDVLAVVDQLPAMTDAVTATADSMFEAIDENADDRISRGEYRQLIEAWTGRETDTDEVFPLLDLDADGHISRDEFRRLWTQFWAGDDPKSPGTWVFGRFDLSPTRSMP
ncbi:Ca2+-binding EF-hand superfamily protein [Amycolatopsis bartoniae]|uniref:Calcium-binding protein n=1 Tax=Amycolatopsis bartoniae TaxID=941986 RepID=A0A8H9IQB1_9PSEU|nr:EF-hand domain-containing protein [Amycolatopsis bartoniae]MBB2934437.1 Ca2+-binding EF-hand superfamily protein [Amycolatopsis bartoniae]TVT02173.1 EF-hand domain-containing protein [Amycolatopsis bartoniae]GHF47367.1 calcium-binding protein [Amycolatopsis bartoniae]